MTAALVAEIGGAVGHGRFANGIGRNIYSAVDTLLHLAARMSRLA
jgi:hypothetical protein